MTEREQAADHLKVIRSLMERATVYRTISWPTALFGGTLAVILAALIFLREQAAIRDGDHEKMISEQAWVGCWMVSLILTTLFNILLVSRKSKREGREFFSPGLKLALRALVPPMLAGGVIGTGLTLSENSAIGASVWVVCYGLALLATRGLAPKSIPRLGWAVLVAGLVAFFWVWSDGEDTLFGWFLPSTESPMLDSNLIMGICFGVFHLLYGVIVMKTGKGLEPVEEE